jgi:hypothetical protein
MKPITTNMHKAKYILKNENLTCVLIKGDKVYKSTAAGIAPMLGFIGAGTDLVGFSAADRVVGRAAAFLFALAGVTYLHAGLISDGACSILDAHGVKYSFDILTDRIENRTRTGTCPMEEAVKDIEDPHAAYVALRAKIGGFRPAGDG